MSPGITTSFTPCSRPRSGSVAAGQSGISGELPECFHHTHACRTRPTSRPKTNAGAACQEITNTFDPYGYYPRRRIDSPARAKLQRRAPTIRRERVESAAGKNNLAQSGSCHPCHRCPSCGVKDVVMPGDIAQPVCDQCRRAWAPIEIGE